MKEGKEREWCGAVISIRNGGGRGRKGGGTGSGARV